MSRIEEIEEAIKNLPLSDLSEFRNWFVQFDADLWDRRIEADIASGKLNTLAAEALADLREGRCTEL